MRVLAAILCFLLLSASAQADGCVNNKEAVFHPDFVKMVRKCGRSTLGNEAKTKACLLNEKYGGMSVSETCATCYGASVKCGATKCRGPCLVGDCTPKCLECITGSSNCNAELKACSGLDKLPPACDESEFSASMKPYGSAPAAEAREVSADGEGEGGGDEVPGGCASANDEKTIWHPEFMESVRSCGRSSWGGYEGALTCLKEKSFGEQALRVSHTCAHCYADSVKCGASNCMGSCMWGDCTKGCLECAATSCNPQLSECAKIAKLPPACKDNLKMKKMMK